MIGKKILSYEIKSLIGEGGMGSVYLAEDPLLKRKVAIKAVLPHLAKNSHIRRRFEEEVKAMSMLSHRNIVEFIDYQISENGLYLIMEYLDGDPLNVYMKKLGSALDEDLAIEITRQVVAACSHAHSKGVIHRDIKPSNIVIGKTGVVKILDFGIAKIAKDQEVQKLTKTGSQIGTIYYMSPEQVQGAPITPATDIYSIGVTLFQMVTGIRPYRNESVEFKVYKRIVDEPLPDVQKVNSNLTVFIQKVIEKATQKEPEKRFKNGKAFHAALGKKEEYLKKVGVKDDVASRKQKGPSKNISEASPWQKHHSKKHNRPYWKNTVTGENTWIEPKTDAKEQPKRPVFLSVLCILTYIGSGLWILIWSFSTMSTLAYFFYYFEPVFVILFAVMYIGIIGLGVLSLIGAIKMWQLKKVGFKLYMASWIIPLSLIFIATAFNISTGARIDDSQFMLYGTTYLIGFTFMLMYGTMKKYLVR